MSAILIFLWPLSSIIPSSLNSLSFLLTVSRVRFMYAAISSRDNSIKSFFIRVLLYRRNPASLVFASLIDNNYISSFAEDNLEPITLISLIHSSGRLIIIFWISDWEIRQTPVVSKTTAFTLKFRPLKIFCSP